MGLMAEEEQDPLLTIDEVADMFGVAPETVRRWITDQQKLEAVKTPTGYLRVRKSEAEAKLYVRERTREHVDTDEL